MPSLIDPRADVSRAILELDAIGFATRQKLHGILPYEFNLAQIQNQWLVLCFQEFPQLGHLVRFDSATHSEDHETAVR